MFTNKWKNSTLHIININAQSFHGSPNQIDNIFDVCFAESNNDKKFLNRKHETGIH